MGKTDFPRRTARSAVESLWCLRRRWLAVAALIGCLIGVALAAGGPSIAATNSAPVTDPAGQVGYAQATFRGTTTTESEAWQYCGNYIVTVLIDEILDDPGELLLVGEEIRVFYDDPLALEAGEEVEVFGTVYRPVGPLQCMDSVVTNYRDGEYIRRVEEPTPTPTPSPTATPEATRTSQWDTGWHNDVWTGASTPEEAFACAEGNYRAAYRYEDGSWESHFPDREDISNMKELEQYDAFVIFTTKNVACQMPMAEPPGTQRTLDWAAGWHNEGWTGPDGTAAQDVFACAEGSYAAAYHYVGERWERYFPDRLDISDMGPLNTYDPFFILVTAPVSCTMAIAP